MLITGLTILPSSGQRGLLPSLASVGPAHHSPLRRLCLDGGSYGRFDAHRQRLLKFLTRACQRATDGQTFENNIEKWNGQLAGR
jgi:hypothetical protein